MNDAADQAETPSGEWLTVPEAARLLGISERTAYRRAAVLTEGSDRVTESGKVRIRRAALGIPSSVLHGSDRMTENSLPVTEVSDRVTESFPSRSVSVDVLLERVEQLQIRLSDAERDRERLSEALEREQSNTAAALARLADADARLAAVLVRQIEPARPDAPSDSPVPESGHGATGTGNDAGDGPKRPWWKIWGRG